MARKNPFKLAILIPTLPARISTFKVLMDNLRKQITDNKVSKDVEILALMDCKTMSIGEKRNRLIDMASSDYIVFIDDDDNVPPYYITSILEAIKTNPDVIGIEGIIQFENNNDTLRFIHSKEYTKDTPLPKHTLGRPANHLNPIKSSIARAVRFPEINYEEDKNWAELIAPKIRTEVMINRLMYVYFAYGSKSQSSPDSKISHI